MKSETIEEATERLRALSEAERAGAEASKEGILAIERDETLDRRAAQVDEHGLALRKLMDERGEIEDLEGAEGGEGEEGAPRRRGRKARK
jgi:hypothetical protein